MSADFDPTQDPGIDPRDYAWIAEHANDLALDGDGVCFAFWRGEQLGPFSCKAEANSALDRRMREAGVEITHGMDAGGVIFADPAMYHVPEITGKPNG
jgi:hypothetical protein